MKKKLIDKVTEYFGNAHRAAKALNVESQQYHSWKVKGFIPFKRGKQIEDATNGYITAEQVWIEAGHYSVYEKE